MNRTTPIDVMTIDQVLKVVQPQPKAILSRPLGPPRTREEVQGALSADRAYAQRVLADPPQRPVTFADYQSLHPKSGQAFSYGPDVGYISPDIGYISPPTVTIGLPNRPAEQPPRARLKPFLVSPTDPGYRGEHRSPPCRATIELEFEVPDVGIVLCPVVCVVELDHSGQPHMGKIFGSHPEDDPDRSRAGSPVGEVFVGWMDREIRT